MRERHHGEPIIEHPNRDKASSRSTRAVVVLLLLISAALMAIITAGGWDVLEGMRAIVVVWIALYVFFAWFVAHWNRGVLPVIAALAVLMTIFAVIAVPSWFDRDAPGFAEPAIAASLLGLLSAILVAVQILLGVVAMQGFRQEWNVEVEHWPEDEAEAGPHPHALPA